MLFKNPNTVDTAYPKELATELNIKTAQRSKQRLSLWPLLNQDNTPLWSLPNTAAAFGVQNLWVKDESKRSELGSFKAIGAPNALINLILKHFPEMKPQQILLGKYKNQLAEFTVISATDGNHGRALAAAAQSSGCPCTIIIHSQVSQEREESIAIYGAKVIRITGNYDKSVEQAERIAKQNNWFVVSDTSYDGYTEIPRDVMQGYAVIAEEAVQQFTSLGKTPSHIILQGGVGGLAAGVLSYFWEQYGAQRPTFIVVEPQQADCLYQSAIKGKASSATGSVDSIMAGLACGQTSPLAWEFLQLGVDYFALLEDQHIAANMSHLAHSKYNDVPIVAGESGVAGLSLLSQLMQSKQLYLIGITPESNVLTINTEGATAPKLYQTFTGLTAQQVLEKQKVWLGQAY